MKRKDIPKGSNRVECAGGGCTVLILRPHPDEYHQEIHLVKPNAEAYLESEHIQEKLDSHVVGVITHTAFDQPCWMTKEDLKKFIKVLEEYLEV